MFMKKIPFSARIVFAVYLLLILVHIGTFLNIDPTLGRHNTSFLSSVFFFVLMPFWILLILKFNIIVKDSNNLYVFNQIRKCLPSWTKKLFVINFIYVIGSFISFSLNRYSNYSLNELGLSSAHFSIFYLVAFVGLTGLANYKIRECKNGHQIKTEAKFCPTCGISLDSIRS